MHYESGTFVVTKLTLNSLDNEPNHKFYQQLSYNNNYEYILLYVAHKLGTFLLQFNLFIFLDINQTTIPFRPLSFTAMDILSKCFLSGSEHDVPLGKYKITHSHNAHSSTAHKNQSTTPIIDYYYYYYCLPPNGNKLDDAHYLRISFLEIIRISRVALARCGKVSVRRRIRRWISALRIASNKTNRNFCASSQVQGSPRRILFFSLLQRFTISHTNSHNALIFFKYYSPKRTNPRSGARRSHPQDAYLPGWPQFLRAWPPSEMFFGCSSNSWWKYVCGKNKFGWDLFTRGKCGRE